MTQPMECLSAKDVQALIADKRYTIIKQVGVGGMACVYLARETDGLNQYAFKVLREEYRQPMHLEIFKREAETMSRFQHPNIVRFYRFVQEDRCAYIRMDYVDGQSLSVVLRHAKQHQKPLKVDDVVRIVAQMVQALDYLHAEGQLHLDIKPGNILIEQASGRVFLTDLGITLGDGEKRRFVAGTPFYMPFEQQNNQVLDKTADVYALAIMTYEMLALRRPFETNTSDKEWRQTLKQLHETALVPPITDFQPTLPSALNAVFEKALAKSPNERYEDSMAFFRAFHHAIFEILSPDLHDIRKIRPQPIVLEVIDDSPPPSRGWGRWVAILLLLLGLGGALVAFALPTLTAEPNTVVVMNSESETPTLLAEATITTFPTETPIPPTDSQETATQSELSVTQAFVETVLLTETLATSVSTEVLETPQPTETAGGVTVTETARPTETATETPHPTVTPTATETPTETPVPTETATFTPTPTLTPQPTAFLQGEPFLPVLMGADAIGLANETLDSTLELLTAEGMTLIPMRLAPSNSFRVEFSVIDPSAWQAYGVVYRYQDPQHYWRFEVQPVDRTWQVVAVVGGAEQVLDRGTLPPTTALSSLVISGKEAFFRYEVGETLLQLQHATPANGQIALWVVPSEGATPRLESLMIGLLGDEAIQANGRTQAYIVPSQVRFAQFFVRDLGALLASADNRGTVDCQAFLGAYDRLNVYLGRDDLASFAQQAQTDSTFIFNRCQVAGAGQTIRLSDSFSDFRSWQSKLQTLLDTVNMTN